MVACFFKIFSPAVIDYERIIKCHVKNKDPLCNWCFRSVAVFIINVNSSKRPWLIAILIFFFFIFWLQFITWWNCPITTIFQMVIPRSTCLKKTKFWHQILDQIYVLCYKCNRSIFANVRLSVCILEICFYGHNFFVQKYIPSKKFVCMSF